MRHWRQWAAWVGLIGLTACAPARVLGALRAPTAAPPPTAVIAVAYINRTPTSPPPTLTAPPACADLAVCWDAAAQAKVAHICYAEARGLLTPGMASCASTVARRQARPDWFGGPDLDTILRWDQFRVDAALTRPWARGEPAPAEALEAVRVFLSGARGEGCWDYDSFRGRTPAEAADFVAAAPERRCAVIRGGQAMIFFNWQDQ